MARPRKVVRSVQKNLALPEDLVARVELMLYSELEGRVPVGAWQGYVSELIRQDLSRRGQEAS